MKIKAQTLKAGAAIVLACAGAGAQELYLNFESFSSGDAINTEAAMAQMSRTNGSAVTFQMHATSSPHRIVTASKPSLLRPVTVSGSSYTNTTLSRDWEVSADNGVNTNYLQWTFAASRKVSYGLGITLTNWSNLGNYYNPASLENGSTYSVLSIIDDNPITMQMETNSNIGASIAVPQNVKIWVTCLWDSANGKTLFHFYNRTNMTLIGVSSGATAANATVKDFRLGIIDAHTKTTGTKYRIGEVILYTNGTQFPVWPGGALQMPTNLTKTAIDAAITAASAGDSVILPAGSNSISSAITISKQLYLSGLVGTNSGSRTILTNTSGSGTTPVFSVDANGVVISNLTIIGQDSGGTITGVGVYMGPNSTPRYGLFTHLHLQNLQVAIWWENYGCARRCTSYNNEYTGRHFGYIAGGATVRSQQYPLAFTSTNFVFWEDCGIENDSGIASSSSTLAIWSSQEAAAYGVRHCNIKVGAKNYSPIADWHGNDPGIPSLRGVLGGFFYKNAITKTGTATIDTKICDVRGGQHRIFSNVLTGFTAGDAYTLREEDSDVPPTDPVENTYIWENYQGASGTTFVAPNVASGSESKIVVNTHYFTNAPSGDVTTWTAPYPWGSAAAAAAGYSRLAAPGGLRIVTGGPR